MNYKLKCALFWSVFLLFWVALTCAVGFMLGGILYQLTN